MARFWQVLRQDISNHVTPTTIFELDATYSIDIPYVMIFYVNMLASCMVHGILHKIHCADVISIYHKHLRTFELHFSQKLLQIYCFFKCRCKCHIFGSALLSATVRCFLDSYEKTLPASTNAIPVYDLGSLLSTHQSASTRYSISLPLW